MRTILIIDDNADIVDLLSLMLKRSGYRVLSAATGREGLQALAKGAAPDLILLDVQLPDMSGPDVLDQVELHQPELLEKDFLFYTAGAAPEDKRVSGTLNKMVDIRKILRVLLDTLPVSRKRGNSLILVHFLEDLADLSCARP